MMDDLSHYDGPADRPPCAAYLLEILDSTKTWVYPAARAQVIYPAAVNASFTLFYVFYV